MSNQQRIEKEDVGVKLHKTLVFALTLIFLTFAGIVLYCAFAIEISFLTTLMVFVVLMMTLAVLSILKEAAQEEGKQTYFK